MALSPFTQTKTQNPEISNLQGVLSRVFQGILGVRIIDGRLIEDVQVTFAGTRINHKLGRKIKGWQLVDKDADESVWRINSSTRPESEITLQATGTTNVTLWVF